jgi:hypothetical protein
MATDFRKSYEQKFGVVEGWLKLYDEEGNEIYCEGSYGRWVKYEYDDKGNGIYCEFSDGYWWKREYDNEGNEIYHESSSSGISADKRNNLEGKIATIDGKEYQLTGIK